MQEDHISLFHKILDNKNTPIPSRLFLTIVDHRLSTPHPPQAGLTWGGRSVDGFVYAKT